KVDMDSAQIEEATDEIVDLLGCLPEDGVLASGKTGLGGENILAAIVDRIPAPTGDPDAPLPALIFDSGFDPFLGLRAYFRIFDGTLNKGGAVRIVHTENEDVAAAIGVLQMDMNPRKTLSAGAVGNIITGIKVSKQIKVGDTITDVNN